MLVKMATANTRIRLASLPRETRNVSITTALIRLSLGRQNKHQMQRCH